MPAYAPGDLITKLEAAQLCGLSRSTFDTYRHAGYVPQPLHVGNTLRWRVAELQAWIDAGCPRSA
jgi:predicted DNA-binding transcriptional regulator AlpA